MDVDRILNIFEQNGLAMVQPFASSPNPNIVVNNYLYAVAVYNGDDFKIATKKLYNENSFYMTVSPKNGLKNSLPFPKNLRTLYALNIHYTLDDLKSEVGEALKEKISTVILPKEIAADDVRHSDCIHDPSIYYLRRIVLPGTVNVRNKPFLVVSYNLQKPNEKHSKCITPIELKDRWLIDQGILPYHKLQDEHFCVIAEDETTEIKLIPVDIEEIVKHGLGLNLNLRFGNIEEERMEKLLESTPLPINTEMRFDEMLSQDAKNISLNIRDTNKSFHNFGNGIFRFDYNYRDSSLEESVSKLLPHFLEVYRAFTR